MGFDVYPGDAPLAVAANSVSDPIEIQARIGPDPAAAGVATMFLRVIELGADGPGDPRIGVVADAGPVADIALFPAVTEILDEHGETVGDADLQREANRIYFVRIRVAEAPGSWKLRISNTNPSEARRYTFVVADNKAETAQPWIDVSAVPEFTVLTGAVGHAGVRVGNRGTGPLRLDHADLTDLGAGFTLTPPPPTVAPNSEATATVTFTGPDQPGRAAATYAVTSNDTGARLVDGHNLVLRVAATVRAPLWAPGDLLVVDPQAGDGGSAGARGVLLRIDPLTGVPTVVTAGGLLNNPTGVAIDADGNAVICDSGAFGGNGGLIRVDKVTGRQAELASGGNFRDPAGLVIAADGSIVVVDPTGIGGAGGLIRVDPARGTQHVLVTGGGLGQPVGVAWEAGGSFVVLDVNPAGGGSQVRRVSASGVLSVIAGGSMAVQASGVAVAPDGGILVAAVVSSGTAPVGTVLRVEPSGTASQLATAGLLRGPARLTVDAAARIVVSDLRLLGDSGGLVRIDPATRDQQKLSGGGPLRAPLGVTTVPAGTA